MGDMWIYDEMKRSEEERADRDRFMVERVDIWKAARTLLVTHGDISPTSEDVLNLAEFLAGDRIGAV